MALAVCKGEGEPEGKACIATGLNLRLMDDLLGKSRASLSTNTTVAVIVVTVLRRCSPLSHGAMEMEPVALVAFCVLVLCVRDSEERACTSPSLFLSPFTAVSSGECACWEQWRQRPRTGSAIGILN